MGAAVAAREVAYRDGLDRASLLLRKAGSGSSFIQSRRKRGLMPENSD
jgi:hypothetical protein